MQSTNRSCTSTSTSALAKERATGRAAKLRTLAVSASLAIALAGTGLGMATAQASVSSLLPAASSGSNTTLTAPSGSGSSAASTEARFSSLDEISQQVIGTWELIGISFDESASEYDAETSQSYIETLASLGLNIELVINADGTYSLAIASETADSSDSDQISSSEIYAGTWSSDGEGIVIDDNAYGALGANGTLSIAGSDGSIMKFATKADVEAGLFTTPSAASSQDSYLADPDGFVYEWSLTGVSSGGIDVPLSMMGTVTSDLALDASSSLTFNEDGTCSMTLVEGGVTITVQGTWTDNGDGTATLVMQIDELGTLEAELRDDGSLFVDSAEGNGDALIFNVLTDDAAAAGSSESLGSTGTSASASSGASTSAGASLGSAAADVSQFVNSWRMISIDTGDSISDDDAESITRSYSGLGAAGIYIDLEINADGTYSISGTSDTLSESQISQVLTFDPQSSDELTWSEEDGVIAFSDGSTAVLNEDGTLTLSIDADLTVTFATIDDVEAGKFTPMGVGEETNYLADPDGYAYEWTITDFFSSDGTIFPIALLDTSETGVLDLNDDGTCTWTVGSATNSSDNVFITGTWVENADGTATLSLEDFDTLILELQDDGSAYLGDESGTVYYVLHVVTDDSNATSGSAASDGSAAASGSSVAGGSTAN